MRTGLSTKHCLLALLLWFRHKFSKKGEIDPTSLKSMFFHLFFYQGLLFFTSLEVNKSQEKEKKSA